MLIAHALLVVETEPCSSSSFKPLNVIKVLTTKSKVVRTGVKKNNFFILPCVCVYVCVEALFGLINIMNEAFGDMFPFVTI
jgi:hypothetical protein